MKSRKRRINFLLLVIMLVLAFMVLVSRVWAKEGHLLSTPEVTLSAQSTPMTEDIKAKLLAAKGTYTVGDVIPLTLTVKHPAGYRVIPMQMEGVWGDFEVRDDRSPEVITNEDGTQTTTQEIMVSLWKPGSYQTPEMEISVVDQKGELITVDVSAVTVEIKSVLTEEDQSLRDIKPQAALPLPPTWLWILMGLVGAALVIGGLIWYRRNRMNEALTEEHEVIDLRKPHEIAFDDLEAIEAQKLAEQGNFKAFYSLISDVLRRYLEAAYQIDSMDRTTSEIRRALKDSNFSLDQRSDIVDLLKEADLVKFAKVIPELKDATAYLPRTRACIQEAIPEEVVEGSANELEREDGLEGSEKDEKEVNKG